MLNRLVEFYQQGSKVAITGKVINQENILYATKEGVFVITGYLIQGVDDEKLYHVPYFNLLKLSKQEDEEKTDSLESLEASVLTKKRAKKKKEELEDDWQAPDMVNDLPF